MSTKTSYLSNPRLKKANTPFKFTAHQIAELQKCAKDPLYFITTYYKIVDVDKGLVPFVPYPYQERMLSAFEANRFVICLLPRQMGKSVSVTAYLLWYILFNDYKNTLVLANKETTAKELLKRVKLAYEHLPIWLQQGVTRWDQHKIELENGSSMMATATSGSAARGGSYSLIYLDEYAFVPENIANEFFASTYPTISSGSTTKVIVTSTPQGLNHFHDMWQDAKHGRSKFVPLEVKWNEHPKRDQAWAEQEKANIGAARFAQEYDCEFLGGELTLVEPQLLSRIVTRDPLVNLGGLDIYERPLKDHRYVITVDTAEGVGQDYSAYGVVDVTQLPYRLVAKYRSKEVSPVFLPHNIVNTAKSYNEAYILVEAATVGYQVGYSIWFDHEYPNCFSAVANKGAIKLRLGYVKGYLGVKMTPRVRNTGCANLKALIESGQLIIEDADLVKELSNFIFNGTRFEAEEGHHDDLVMSMVVFAWLVKQQNFRSMTQTNFEITRDLEEDRFVPFIIAANPNVDPNVEIDPDGTVWNTINSSAFGGVTVR
jgi:hypothetical protein